MSTSGNTEDHRTVEDFFPDIAHAFAQVKGFTEFLITRAELFAKLNHKTDRKMPHPEVFITPGYAYGLLAGEAERASDPETTAPIGFYWRDVQSDGPMNHFRVPKEFLFSETAETEAEDYAKYLELKARFEG